MDEGYSQGASRALKLMQSIKSLKDEPSSNHEFSETDLLLLLKDKNLDMSRVYSPNEAEDWSQMDYSRSKSVAMPKNKEYEMCDRLMMDYSMPEMSKLGNYI